MRAGYHPGKTPGKKQNGEKTLKEQGFYHTSAWRRARRMALQRDKYLCQLKTSSRCTRVATEVHHVRPLESAPELALDLANLVSCCWFCHEETKRKQKQQCDPAPKGVRVIRISGGEDPGERE